VPTLLFEAGHYKNDYNREEVRRYIFIALLKSFEVISKGVDLLNYEDYFNIPENSKCFYDIIIRNARILETDLMLTDIAIQYKEVLEVNTIVFKPIVEVVSKLDNSYGHKEIDAKAGLVRIKENFEIKVTTENDFVLLNNRKILLKP
jgi:hypothetical protein